MSIRTWMTGLHIRERYVRGLLESVQELQERLHRLEIAHRELRDHFVLLDAQNEKLAGRLDGRRGGRPKSDQASSLDEIPHGDKAALRRSLGVVPGRPFHHQQE
jgi:RNase adaptor protein for sRNA GlmZ degradation